MLDACSDIVEAMAGVALADFTLGKLRHKAVVRDLEILGGGRRAPAGCHRGAGAGRAVA